jgi:hypothetical protein
MKRLFSLLALCMFAIPMIAIPASAQDQTSVGEEFHSSGFGGPALKVTRFYDKDVVMEGAGGAWYINHALGLGIAGYHMSTSMRGPLGDSSHMLEFGYGGGTIEYVISSESLLHFSVSTLVGAGAVSYSYKRSNPGERNEWGGGDAFFVVEPGANIEVNLTKFMRADIGASYRWVNGIELDGLNNSNVNGPAANVMLKFGAF